MHIKRLTETAVLPIQATAGAAGFDLTADSIQLSPTLLEAVIDTGLAVAVPEHHVLLIFSRSGQGFKNDVRLANCVGVIDSDYRGPLKVKLTSDGPKGMDYLASIRRGDRIAQMVLFQIPTTTMIEVDELDETVRGEGGLGSTGK